MIDAKLQDEPGRLAALHRYELLDTPREEAFDRITGLVKTVFGVPMASVSLIDADRQWLKSCFGMSSLETPRDITFCTHTIQERTPLYIPDATADSRFSENPLVTGAPFIRSYLGVPLCTPDGYNVGALCAMDIKPRTYAAEQIEVLRSFGALVVDEMELRRIAQTDHLTGAATRRGFCLEADKAMAKFSRSGTPSTMIVLDIDHFKKVNDTYGHPTGDAVLRKVGATLGSLLRSGDSLGRLGGEEFGVVLADTDVDEGLQAAERMREALEHAVIEHATPFHVTASFGVAALDGEIASSTDWIAKADKALYAAKHGGRNQCCVAAEDARAQDGTL